jgi:hypothetical protein
VESAIASINLDHGDAQPFTISGARDLGSLAGHRRGESE